MSYSKLKSTYMGASLNTASKEQLLVMLFERLVQDMDRGIEAIHTNNYFAANENLIHAQEILVELLDSLDLSAWKEAENLDALYRFMLSELVKANTGKDAGIVKQMREIAQQLYEAWRDAAVELRTQI